jgi:hypothetical protein
MHHIISALSITGMVVVMVCRYATNISGGGGGDDVFELRGLVAF